MSKWVKRTAATYQKGRQAIRLFKGVRAAWKSYKSKARKSRQKSTYSQKRFQTRIVGKGLTGEQSTVTINYKKPKKSVYAVVQNLGNEQTYTIDETNATVSDVGVQSVTNFSVLNKTSDLANAVGQASQFYNSITSTYVAPSYTQMGNQMNKYFLRQSILELSLTSQSPAVTNLTIYTCISKVTKPTYVDPATDWANGLLEQQDGGAAYASPTYVGAKPWESKLFNINWRVQQAKTIQLMGGAQHKHSVRWNVNRILDTAYQNNFSQIRGITCAVFIVLWGQPGDINNGHTNAGANVSITPTKIVGIQTRQYKYTLCNVFPKNTYQATTNLLQAPQPHIYVINEESGDVVDVQDVTTNTVYA